jgi:hypothetical protein
MIGCTCSELQLAHVGCECVEMIVSVWPKGYADDAGLKTASMSHKADYASEARKLFGMSATVYQVREAYPIRRTEKFSPDYIREMSIGG